MKARFYEGDLWKKELEGVLQPMLEKYDVVLVEDSENRIRWLPRQAPSPLDLHK
jgi:hypothetical protein